ncbi:DUF2252 domain-containing protein [Microbacterium sp. CFH 90308]|uniref:DUF2252 domain-containing protein n=1 Tax=Microbacterium salsuginis TaxID=2722803 RepID=A0ABX1K6U9_9MICO|nr:DUF2252 domain-containing protein [Microbacterium sp. CFH 90308]NLP82741.1 DUF2252 domain-containing protein [Microbacterium sp. CFH 90308]
MTKQMSATVDDASLSSTPGAGAFEERRRAGRAARSRSPRSGHGAGAVMADRFDPVSLLEQQSASRVRELVPLRYDRMTASPFAFFRGAALLMAADLATAPSSGLNAQLCGDAHLSNFGLFASPERQLVFDINDFDETLPGPFEWDLKRLVTSFEIAGRHRGFSENERRPILRAAALAYRERMIDLAKSSVLDAWYDRLDAGKIASWLRDERKAERAGKSQIKGWDSIVAKAQTKDRNRAFSRLVVTEGGRLRIMSDPPLVVPVEELFPDDERIHATEVWMRDFLEGYRQTLPAERHPLAEYRYVHMARSVGGIGSVGTRCWILLLTGKDDTDPLILQAKEAQASVLERFLPPSKHSHHGERVVRGQRLLQAASDIFLGWHRTTEVGGGERDFYLRQLHDWKGSVDPEVMVPRGAMLYARLCGETLARGHARTGDRVQIAAYLGRSQAFDNAIVAFAEAYADQNEKDHAAFVAAIASGRLTARSI